MRDRGLGIGQQKGDGLFGRGSRSGIGRRRRWDRELNGQKDVVPGLEDLESRTRTIGLSGGGYGGQGGKLLLGSLVRHNGLH